MTDRDTPRDTIAEGVPILPGQMRAKEHVTVVELITPGDPTAPAVVPVKWMSREEVTAFYGELDPVAAWWSQTVDEATTTLTLADLDACFEKAKEGRPGLSDFQIAELRRIVARLFPEAGP